MKSEFPLVKLQEEPTIDLLNYFQSGNKKVLSSFFTSKQDEMYQTEKTLPKF